MSNYPEYGWIQDSVNSTRTEIGKTNDLVEAIKRKTKKLYSVFPESVIRNPLEPIFIELESGKELFVLKYFLSEN
jgi:hypothetical protein